MADNATRLNEQAANLRDVVVSARATAQDALLNLLQSSGANFQGGAKLSAATKAAMGKRGLNQVEVLKGALDRTVEEADMLVKDADCLRAEVKATLKASREAVDAAEAAKRAHEEGLADAQAEVTRRAAAMDEERAASAAEVESALETARSVEARAAAAEQALSVALGQRSDALAEAEEAKEARASSEEAAAKLEAQATRERELLARLAAENLLFVKQLQQTGAERDRAEREKHELQTRWREQTEQWFRKAAGDLQAKLLEDWGVSEGLQLDLGRQRGEAAAGQRAAMEAGELRRQVAELEEKLARTQEAAAQGAAQLLAAKEQLGLQQAERQQLAHEAHQLRAQAQQGASTLAQARAQEAHWRAEHEAAGERLLHLTQERLREQHETEQLRERLHSTEQAMALSKAVSERVRAEAADEHAALLEAQARLGMSEEAQARLMRENEVLVRSMPGLQAVS